MTDIFKLTTRPPEALFFRKNDPNDLRLGELVLTQAKDYAKAEIVILGCPQDEGVRRNKGRAGAAQAPNEIRKHFYRMSNFAIKVKIFDLGNTTAQNSLEEIHERQSEIVWKLITDGKRVISLGGGNDIAFPDCKAVAVALNTVLAFNIDAHFDVRADASSNSGTPYRQLLEGSWLKAENFYEIGWQPQANSPVYFEYLQSIGANLIGLEEIRRQPNVLGRLREVLQKSNCNGFFFGFDLDAVRASDAPGVSAASPLGLTAESFCALSELAGSFAQTRVIEFSEMNPNFDVDGRTAKLTATAMHRFCAAVSSLKL
jgi:formiminoglutamase